MHYRFWFWSSSHSNRKSYLKLQLHLDLCANPLTKVSKEDMNWNRILIVTHFIASLKSDWTIQPFPLISLSKQWANSSYELSVHTTEIANGKKPSCSSFSMRKRKPLYLIEWTHTHTRMHTIHIETSICHIQIHPFLFLFFKCCQMVNQTMFSCGIFWFGITFFSSFELTKRKCSKENLKDGIWYGHATRT